jgi:hypothetical protein
MWGHSADYNIGSKKKNLESNVVNKQSVVSNDSVRCKPLYIYFPFVILQETIVIALKYFTTHL